MSMYGKNHYNTVISLQLKWIKEKKDRVKQEDRPRTVEGSEASGGNRYKKIKQSNS